MDTRKPTANSQPLWMIAFSLFIIAMCLVMLVLQQRAMFSRPPVQAAPAPAEQKHFTGDKTYVPAFARPSAAHDHELRTAKHASSRVADENVTARLVPAAAPEVIPVVAREPEPVAPVGIAPLAIAPTNDTPQTNDSGAGIFGRVILKGRPPKETVVVHDAICGQTHLKPITTRRYEVSPDGGLANVFVWISGGLKPQKFVAPSPALLDQVECQFEPYIMGVLPNQGLVFTNSDPTFHNVRALLGNETLFERYDPSYQAFGWRFRSEKYPSDPGTMSPLRIRCDVHPWMSAYVCEVGNPYFAVTDSEGNFTITNVPTGVYQLSAFHVHTYLLDGKFQAQDVRVAKDQMSEANFVIQARSR